MTCIGGDAGQAFWFGNVPRICKSYLMTELRQRMMDAMVKRGFAHVTRHPMGCRIGYRIYGACCQD
jgi:hypothetical protein